MSIRWIISCLGAACFIACGGNAPHAPATDAYLQSLPPWPAPAASKDESVGTTKVSEEVIEGVVYACSSTPHSITQTPEKLVTLNPGADLFWPGVLLQGKSYQGGLGSFVELPIRQRAPLEVSVDLLFSGNTRKVDRPTNASVNQAVGQIIQEARDANLVAQSSIDYSKTAAYSVEQSAVALGLSARYLSVEAKARLKASHQANRTTIAASFTQRAFTVSVAPPQTPAKFFSEDFTQADLQQQIDLGRLGPDNLPVYLSSVSYGRILLFSFTAQASKDEIVGTLNVMFNGVAASGSVSLSARQMELLQTSEISVFTLGGDADNALALIRSGNLADFFKKDAAITSFVPISYVLRNLGDNSIARVSETTSYDLRECVASTASDVPKNGLVVELKMNGSERVNNQTLNSAPAAASQGIIQDGCRIANTADRFGFAERAFDMFGSGGCDAAEPSLVHLEAPGYSNSFTFATWLVWTLSNEQWIVGPRGGPALVTTMAQKAVFEIPGKPSLVDPTPLSRDVWTFFVVTAAFDGASTAVKLYRDGKLVAQASVAGNLGASPSAPTLIGNQTGGPGVPHPGRARDFQGKLDDLRIYNRALSESEIAVLYAQAPGK